MQRIEELRDEIGEDDFRVVIDIFRLETEEVIARLATPLDEAGYANAIHFLRSGALNLGLTGIASEAENSADVAPSSRPSVAVRLRDIVARSIDAIGFKDIAA